MKIRKASSRDIKDIAELDNQFWSIHENIDPFIEPEKKLTEKDYLKHAKRLLNSKKKNEFFFVAEVDSKIVGIINFKIEKNDSFFKIKSYGYLESITIHKDYRKKGIAKKLIGFVLNFLKKKRINYVKFNTNWKNKNAINAFRKMKFQEKNIMFYKKIK